MKLFKNRFPLGMSYKHLLLTFPFPYKSKRWFGANQEGKIKVEEGLFFPQWLFTEKGLARKSWPFKVEETWVDQDDLDWNIHPKCMRNNNATT